MIRVERVASSTRRGLAWFGQIKPDHIVGLFVSRIPRTQSLGWSSFSFQAYGCIKGTGDKCKTCVVQGKRKARGELDGVGWSRERVGSFSQVTRPPREGKGREGKGSKRFYLMIPQYPSVRFWATQPFVFAFTHPLLLLALKFHPSPLLPEEDSHCAACNDGFYLHSRDCEAVLDLVGLQVFAVEPQIMFEPRVLNRGCSGGNPGLQRHSSIPFFRMRTKNTVVLALLDNFPASCPEKVLPSLVSDSLVSPVSRRRRGGPAKLGEAFTCKEGKNRLCESCRPQDERKAR